MTNGRNKKVWMSNDWQQGQYLTACFAGHDPQCLSIQHDSPANQCATLVLNRVLQGTLGIEYDSLSMVNSLINKCLTGDRITLPRRHSEETQERSAQAASDLTYPFDIYPNPVGDHILTIVAGNTDTYTVQVINIQGVLVSETGCVGDCKLDLSTATSGIHIVRVLQLDRSVHVEKIVRL